jgi:Domain of unknown function (DUF4062)
MPVRIFLSAVSKELRDYRDQLRDDLERRNVEVEIQEHFKDLGTATLEKLDTYIRSCDAVRPSRWKYDWRAARTDIRGNQCS